MMAVAAKTERGVRFKPGSLEMLALCSSVTCRLGDACTARQYGTPQVWSWLDVGTAGYSNEETESRLESNQDNRAGVSASAADAVAAPERSSAPVSDAGSRKTLILKVELGAGCIAVISARS
jgi:hypothetical protein